MLCFVDLVLFMAGYSVHWKFLLCCLAKGCGSNMAAWSHVKPGLE